MTNIMLSRYDIGKKWCLKELKKYIKKGSTVAVVALSFGNEISSADDWERFYGKKGVLSTALEKAFKHYGIPTDNIEYINAFRDTPETAKKKLQNADILYIPGGAPEKIMERVIELGLYSDIEGHKGAVIGFGAGAQVQLANYHIPSAQNKMCYGLGFRFAEGFDIEPNYTVGDELQNFLIRRVITETGIPVYAIEEDGAVIIENGVMRVIGKVHCFKSANANKNNDIGGSASERSA
ncbi:MAG: Type 1 glutamine amidotransferase-like domain-containing protein [Oscillospiraceae bacterium]|nr:Type 1 glutamine amidotransferase-like domain-containing protein [Oscillospiraceae bacterium]